MLLRAFFANRKSLLPLLIGLGLAVGALEGLFILAAKSAVSGVAANGWGVTLSVLAGLVTLRTLAQLVSTRLEMRGLFSWLRERRESLLREAAARSFPAYRDPWRNTLVTALEEGLEEAGQGVGAGIRCLAALLHALVLAPLLFLFSWKLAALALLLAVPALAAGRLRARMLAESGRLWSESKAELSRRTEGFAEGLEAHLGNGSLAEASRRLAGDMEGHARRARAWETAKAVFPPALEWFFFLALAALALAAGAGRDPGAGPLGLLPFGALLLLMYRPIREWARNHPIHLLGAQAWTSLRNLQATLESLPARGPAPRSPSGTILLERVGFAYRPGRPVLAELSLDLDPSALTWISGRNGAGKSTLLKLLAGMESPLTGRILLPSGWSEPPFAYLPQKAFLEPDWDGWALAYRKDHPAAWKILDGILGLDALLAKAGPAPKGLSGGERQRLCLARVFASPAPYLLLDEPTTWLAAGDRERILGDLLEFWRRSRGGPERGAALVSHEPFIGEFCSRTVRLEAHPVEAAP